MAKSGIKYYARGDRHHVQAQRIWMILAAVVALREALDEIETITYGRLASLMGYDPRAGRTLARQLGMVGRFCLAHGLPALNSIVVNAESEEPGHEVVTTHGRTWREEQQAVMAVDWFALRVPSTSAFRDAPAAPDTDLKFVLTMPNPGSENRHLDWVTMQIGMGLAIAGLSGGQMAFDEREVDGKNLLVHFRVMPPKPVEDGGEFVLGHLRARFASKPGYVVELQ